MRRPPILRRNHFPVPIRVYWLPDGTQVQQKRTRWLVFRSWWRYWITRSYQRDRERSMWTETDCSVNPPVTRSSQ